MELELDGELYYHGMEFEDIHSIVSRKVNQHSDFELMQYHVFDVVIDWMPQASRVEALKVVAQACCKMPSIKFVEHREVETEGELFELLYSAYDGYEGFIVRDPLSTYVRHRSTAMMKFKPKKRDHYLVVGFQEEISIEGVPKGALGSLLCEKDGQVFSVGSGSYLTRENRNRLWEERLTLPGKIALVEYQYLTKDRAIPRHGVLVSLVDPKEVKE